jgi:hypothetical protein
MKASISIRGVQENDNEGSESVGLQRGMDVLDAAYHTAHSFPGGVPALAPRMGISQNVLASKLNVNSDTHHLTLRQTQTLMDVTDNDAILRAMADHRGYDLIRTLPANTDCAESLYWQAAAASAEFLAAVADAMHIGVTRNSMRRADNLGADAMSHMNNLLGALRARLPVPPKATSK